MCYTAADDEDDVVVALVSRKGRAASLSPPAQADEDSTAPSNAPKQPPAVSDSRIKDANSPARHVDSKKMSSQKVRLCYPIWAANHKSLAICVQVQFLHAFVRLPRTLESA